MKKVMFGLAVLLVAGTGCSKENVNNSADYGSGSSSGVSGVSTLKVTEDQEDFIANTSFDRTITITFNAGGTASVSGDANGIVSVSGNHVSVDNTGTTEKVRYELSGSASDGSFKVYSNNKQAFVLNGLSLTNPNGAAINNQGKKRCFVVVSGTNTLADGSSYTATPSDEDEKAAFFSEGQLIFSGDGSLTVSAKGKSGIVSDDYIHLVASPTLNVTSTAGHAVRGKDAVIVSDGVLEATASAAMKKGVASDSLVLFNGGATTIKVSGGTAYDDEDAEYKSSAGVKADQLFIMNAGTLSVTNSGIGGKGISGDGPAYFQGGTVSVKVTGTNYGSSSSGGMGRGGWGGSGSSDSSDNSKSAKGIKFDGDIYVSGGSISATSSNHEGIESKGKILIGGGTVYAQSSDDAINSAKMMAITGGQVCAYSTGNDGLDANGNLYIEGGVVYAIGSGGAEVAIDANTEGGYKLYVNGGTLFAVGGVENGASLSQACYQTSSWNKNTWYALTVGNDTYCFKTPSSGGTGLVVSGASQPSLYADVSPSGGTSVFGGMDMMGGSASGGTSVSLSAYSGGNGMGGGMGPGGNPGGRPGGW
ncbi:MAG: carbohydrate-binding domain-containing protein [Candidatus Cryptobacteroides sp.]|nr:carbohydrate-binding domain-containing protein [Candidatus Cryptobacteroides sp.]